MEKLLLGVARKIITPWMKYFKHIQPFCDDADYCLMKETVEHIKAMENRGELKYV